MAVLNQFRLDGQVAVVTGGGKGIGRSIVLKLAEAGADVAIAARSRDDVEAVAAEVESLGRRAIAVPTDVTVSDQLRALAERCVTDLGGLTVWVSNAGGLPDATPRYLTRTPRDRFEAQIELNLTAVWDGAVIAAEHMGDAGGAIVNISSRAAIGPQLKNGPYGASKAAVNSLTSTLSVELAPRIRVNAVAPGPIPTENFIESTHLDPAENPKLAQQMGVPLGRLGTGDDIGAAVVFMASPAASWITGQCLYVTGGL